MKKKISLFVASVLTIVALPAATFAVGNPAVTYVSGTVTNGINPVNGANVTVTCDGNTLTDTTDNSGGYLVEYSPASLCPNGATSSVSATKGSLSGSNSGPVNKKTSKLNIALVDVSVVPEMGLIAAVSAAVIGTGAFIAIRNRKLSGHQS